MKRRLIIGLICSAATLMLAPLYGWGLAQTNLPPVLVVYIIMVLCLWPTGIVLWAAFENEAEHARRAVPLTSPERGDGK